MTEVHSQTFPYVSFMGQTLANQCITNLHTCCSSSQGAHRGDWYFPNGSMLRFSGDVFDVRRAQRVDLSGVSPSHGYILYFCAIYIN